MGSMDMKTRLKNKDKKKSVNVELFVLHCVKKCFQKNALRICECCIIDSKVTDLGKKQAASQEIIFNLSCFGFKKSYCSAMLTKVSWLSQCM